MNAYRKLTLAATLLSTATSVLAMSPETFDSLAVDLAMRNPALASLQANNQAQILQMQADNQLPPPEIEVDNQWGYDGVGNKYNITVSQSFDWPGVYSARAKANDAQSVVLQLMHQSQLVDRVNDIRQELVTIAYYNQRLAVHRYVCKNSQQLLDLTKQSYEKGQTNILNVYRMRIETTSLSREVTNIENELQASISRLAMLSDGDYAHASDIAKQTTNFVVWPLLDEDTYRQWALERDPALKVLEAGKQAALLRLEAEKKSAFPGFSLGYHFSREQDETFNGFTAAVTLPFLRKNRMAQASAELVKASTYDYETELMKVGAQTLADWKTAERLRASCAEMSQIFDNHEYLRLLDMALKGGQINYTEYISDTNFFHMAQEEYLMSEYELAQTMVRLNRFNL